MHTAANNKNDEAHDEAHDKTQEEADNELRAFFTRLYTEDYTIIRSICESLSDNQLWTPTPEGVSIANLICHVCEMEAFWIDWGLCGKEFTRDRQLEFDRRADLSRNDLLCRLDQRTDTTLHAIENLSNSDWSRSREFHGDRFTGQGILLWHSHHLGLHRGHIQTHSRWVTAKKI